MAYDNHHQGPVGFYAMPNGWPRAVARRVDTLHLLLALTRQEGGVVPALLEKSAFGLTLPTCSTASYAPACNSLAKMQRGISRGCRSRWMPPPSWPRK